MSSDLIAEPGSFRDKNNRVFYRDGRIFRRLNADSLADWKALSAAPFYRQLIDEQKLVGSRLVDQPAGAAASGDWVAVLEHDRVPFISYPYEWPFNMLKDAALLQLELIEFALSAQLTLKDATPYNIQFIGSRPVFIDIPSFTRWVPGEPWAGYRQFCELFLFPLFLQAYKNLSYTPWLRGSLEGIPVDACRQFWSLRDLLRPGIFSHVVVHSKLQNKFNETKRVVRSDLKGAGFGKELILANIRSLAKVVRGLSWKQPGSEWSDYATARSYTPEDYERKKKFVGDFIRAKPRRLVWDLGCNTGDFSRLAAGHAEYVVSMDADPWVIEGLYQGLRQEKNRKILPLVMNFANTSSAQGWRGSERKALTERGRPDLALCLALIHHIVISANVPMEEWVDWLAGWGSELVIEFVTRDDPMTKRLLLNKEGQHLDYTRERFEQSLGGHFQIRSTETLSQGTRILYGCERK